MKKTRAERDAERLKELEAEQGRIDSGDISIDEVNIDHIDDSAVGEPELEPFIPDPAPEPRGIDVSALEHEIANLKRTVSHYEQELNPAQKRAQQLEREVEELRARLAEQPRQAEGPTDYGLSEDEQEFDTVKSIAEKVSRVQADTVSKKLLAEIENLKKKVSAFESVTEQAAIDTQISKHRSELSRALDGDNPDVLFSHPKIAAWADTQSEEESLALRNPLAYSPKFVAGVLTRFKAEVLKGQAKREPSHGDLAVPSRIAPDVVRRRDGGDGVDPAFNPATFQKDVNKLISDGKTAEAEKLIAVAERAMSA